MASWPGCRDTTEVLYRRVATVLVRRCDVVNLVVIGNFLQSSGKNPTEDRLLFRWCIRGSANSLGSKGAA